jgi:putative serine protease PepD
VSQDQTVPPDPDPLNGAAPTGPVPAPPRPPQYEAPVAAAVPQAGLTGGPGGPWPPPRPAPYPGSEPSTHPTTVLFDQHQPDLAAPAAPRTGTGTADRRRLPLGMAAGVVGLCLLAGIGGGAIGASLANDNSTGSGIIAAPAEPGDVSPPAANTIAAIAEAVTPAVVNIEAASASGAGTGSGFVISSDGTIVTNNHVIAGARGITVNFEDGTSAPAELVGADEGYDLAVLKVDKTGLPVLELGSSANVQVGDTAIAVGSPLGLSGTVTLGIISALNRPVTTGDQTTESFINAIQTDAAINPGNSGGPLLNSSGQVIGVNSAIASLGSAAGGQSGSIGLGFAIPIDTAGRIVDEIIRTGSAQTPIIGVQIENTADGPRVAEVTPGGPADTAGVRAGDKIVAVDGRPIQDSTGLIVAVRDKAVGDTVDLTIERNGRTQDIQVTLAAKP